MSKKILIIEDRRENIVFIANNILKPMGYKVITARDGQTGLEKAQSEQPDLIITDLKLPKMNGLEVLEHLQEKNVRIPAIVMTFHGTEATAVKALRLGAKDYLIKPFTVEEMEEALKRALQPNSGAAGPEPQAQVKIQSLEKELEQARTLLATREKQLKQAQQSSNHQTEMAKLARQASVWEEDNARLNQLLAQTKEALSEAQSHNKALEEAVVAQKTQLGKYQKEAKRLADELRNLSEAVRLMAQDMEHQMERMTAVIPQE